MEPGPLEHSVLTTGPPGKSLSIFFKKDFIFYVGVELIDNVLVSSVQQTDSVVYIYIDTYSFPDSFLAVLILMFKLSHIWPVAACRGWLLCL